jgi:hypothetical protein
MFKPFTLVVLTNEYSEYLKSIKFNPFKKDKMFVYMGEIPNMLGHCVVAGYDTGIIYAGYHPENFMISPDHPFD